MELNKFQSKLSKQVPNNYLNYVVNSIFQGINKILGLSFKDDVLKNFIKETLFPL